jgi:thioesterase domain-containing protein
MSPEAFTAFLHESIPLTAAMGLRVLGGTAGSIELLAPLQPNRNHQGAAFGGALATLGIVSGWALLQQELERQAQPAKIVVQRSECDYLAPVDAEFTSRSSLDPAEWERFLAMLRRRGRARITVPTTLHCAGREAVRHSGIFVAMTGSPNP